MQFIKLCLCVFRVKKLKETLVAAQQLDKNMSNLRSWLTRVEAELSRPITYSVCHHQEIQRRLAEQQVHTNTHIQLLLTQSTSGLNRFFKLQFLSEVTAS